MRSLGETGEWRGYPAIEREMQVRICPTLLPTIKTYVSKPQFPLALQGLKQINVFATDNREEKTIMVWPRQEDARGENT
jgi:hypothetical protein